MSSFLKDYEPVEDRLREFWQQHPQGRVVTELLHHADGAYIVLARVYRGDELRDNPPAATGLARDAVDELDANLKRSALEVCETSAIGRALANLGYAPKGKRPSREEMQKASASSSPTPVTRTSTEPSASGRDGDAEREEEGDQRGEAAAPSSSPPWTQTTPELAGDVRKDDLSFHPNSPHRMAVVPDFPNYIQCTKRPCPYWEYVGKEKA